MYDPWTWTIGRNVGGRGWTGWSGVKGGKWDNCNSIINKYIFFKRQPIDVSLSHWCFSPSLSSFFTFSLKNKVKKVRYYNKIPISPALSPSTFSCFRSHHSCDSVCTLRAQLAIVPALLTDDQFRMPQQAEAGDFTGKTGSRVSPEKDWEDLT